MPTTPTPTEFPRNWLGNIVAKRVRPTDEVLDLGCGIMPATGGRLDCKLHVGVDSFKPYLDRIGPPVLLGRLPQVVEELPSNSYDVVLLLDIVEHLVKLDASILINEAERLARREVILFTPDGPCPQMGWDAWGMAFNADQAHLCEFTYDELVLLGYKCQRYPTRTVQHGPITSVLGMKQVA